MKKPIPKLFMTVPLSPLLTLLLLVSISSCSKPNLSDIVREHIRAVNSDDIEKNLTFFTDDVVFEIFSDMKLSGKDQLRGLMESDLVNNARITINGIKKEGDAIIVDLIVKNEGNRLLGIEEIPFKAIYKPRGRLLEKVKVEVTSEVARLYNEKYKPFAEWVSKEHPQEFSRMEKARPSAENARLYLSLLKEWRDKIPTERLDVEKELIKLENEWADALVKHDWQFIERILADDYLVTDFEGVVGTKAQEIAFLRSGEFAITSCVHHELKVRVYGDAAVVTGRSTVKETYKGKDYTPHLRWTDTWVRSAGRWQCVAGHSSEIAPKHHH